MKRALLAFAALLAAIAPPAWAGSAETEAAESAARISSQLDRALRDTELRLALERAAAGRGVLVTPDGILFLDGPELPFGEIEWVEQAARRAARRPVDTDTLLRVRPGMTLSLSNLSGDIRVIAWDRNEVRVQAEHDKRDVLIAEIRDDTVQLGVGSRHASPEVEWTLTVPAWLPLELSGIESEILVSGMRSPVRAQSMRGDVTVSGCQGPLEVNSVEGEVHVTDVRGTVTAGSINNVVRIVRVTGPVEAQTINGDIQLVKLESPNVDASTVNGRVYYASGYQPRGRYLFSSHNGKLIVPMPDDQHVKVSMSSFQGQVESSIPMPAPAPAPSAKARGRHFRFVMRDGVATSDPVPAPPVPKTPKSPRPEQPARAPYAPEIELESFGGLIRLASQQEVLQVLSEQRELLAMRRAAIDSARVHQMRARGEMERARRYERTVKGREAESRRNTPPPAPAPVPETPPPPPLD